MLLKLKHEYIGCFYIINKDIPEGYLDGKSYIRETYYELNNKVRNIFLKVSKKKEKIRVLNGSRLHVRNYIDVLYDGKILTVDEMFFEKL